MTTDIKAMEIGIMMEIMILIRRVGPSLFNKSYKEM